MYEFLFVSVADEEATISVHANKYKEAKQKIVEIELPGFDFKIWKLTAVTEISEFHIGIDD